MGSNSSENQSFGKVERLSSPFGEVGHSISDSELRETAFEILVCCCCWHGRSESTSTDQKYQTHNILVRTARVTPGESKKLQTVEEMGIRMGVSKLAYGRIKNAWGMIQAAMKGLDSSRSSSHNHRKNSSEKGRNITSILLPLELLEEFTLTDFGNQQKELNDSRIRHLKILEAGLLPNRQRRLGRTHSILHEAWKTPIKDRAETKWMQDYRQAATSLASSSSDGSDSSIYHWADRFPLNLRLYEMLLDACFEINDKTSIVEEVDKVIELIKLTWGILGVNQMLHVLCFSSVLFRRSVENGQVYSGLLLKAATQLVKQMERTNSNMISSKNQSNPSQDPSILHNDIGDQAKKEKEGFSPLWNTCAALLMLLLFVLATYMN